VISVLTSLVVLLSVDARIRVPSALVLSAETCASGLCVHWDPIIAFEGFSSKFYVPSETSGPTIGTGIDLGHVGAPNIRRIFGRYVDTATLRTLLSASGLRGSRARSWCRRAPALTDTQVWAASRKMVVLFRSRLLQEHAWLRSAPPGVLDAVLSFYIHHGSTPRIQDALVRRDLDKLAAALRAETKFTNRRTREADLVLAHRQPKAPYYD